MTPRKSSIASQKYLPRIKVLLRDNYKRKNGTRSVLLVVHLNGKKIRFNTGIWVSENMFDSFREEILSGHPQARDYNLIVEKCRSRINEIYIKYRLLHEELTPEVLKTEYRIKSTYVDFFRFMEDAIQERTGEIAPSSAIQHMATLSKIKEFKNTLRFSEINDDFINRFTRHLKIIRKNKISTVANTLKNFKTYMNLAIRNGIIDKNPFDRIKLIRSKPDRMFLEEDELRILCDLYKKQSLSVNYQMTLRAYLFGCFTGLRISDIRALNMENIIGNIIVVYPFKTRNKKNEVVKIPISRFADRLIHDASPFRLYGRIFGLWADQVMNRQLRDIIAHAKIKKKLSFHSSRHTFATIFLRRSKNLAVLQKLLGHSNIRETMVYAHILTEDIENEMKVWDDFF